MNNDETTVREGEGVMQITELVAVPALFGALATEWFGIWTAFAGIGLVWLTLVFSDKLRRGNNATVD